MKRIKGVVSQWAVGKKFGFCVGEDLTVYLIHSNDLLESKQLRGQGYVCLNEGTKVSFVPAESSTTNEPFAAKSQILAFQHEKDDDNETTTDRLSTI